MAKVIFTSHLRQVGPTEPQEIDGNTVGEVFVSVFERFPALRSYIYDDQNRIRKHIAIFIDGERLDNGKAQMTTVSPATEIFVLQALSGG